MKEAAIAAEPGHEDDLTRILTSVVGIERVEDLVREKLGSDVARLVEIPDYLLSLGGKRVRPIIALCCGRLFGLDSPPRQLVDVAAGIELIHMATLLHDDIIDRSPLRRGKPSPFARFGLESTLLSGDFLLVRAFSLCAHLDTYTIDWTERACIALTEGEMLEVPLSERDHAIESVIDIARRKTASLFALAARSGAHFAGCSDEIAERMAGFGEELGIAFQVLDDVLDVTGTEEVLGKQPGVDLRERKPSAVNVLWLASGDPAAELLRTPASRDDDRAIAEALERLRHSPVIDQARSLALEHARRASEHLAAACEAGRGRTHVRLLLEGLIKFAIARLR